MAALVRNLAGTWNGRTRLIVFVFGGLLTLQNSDALSLPKVFYLVVRGAVVGAAVWSVRDLWSDHRSPEWPWVVSSALFVALLAVSLPVALLGGTSPVSWLRDASTYGLFAAAPIMAFDARRASSTRDLTSLSMVAGLLASVSFAVEWFARRSILALPFDRLVLPSGQVASALFIVGVAWACRGPSIGWVGAALAGFSCWASSSPTGTRTAAAILLVGAEHPQWPWPSAGLPGAGRLRLPHWSSSRRSAPLARSASRSRRSRRARRRARPLRQSPALNRRRDRRSRRRLGPSTGSTVPATPLPTARPQVIGERIGSLGDLFRDPGSQGSFRERLAQTRVAWEAFLAHPLVGVGPGKEIAWFDHAGSARQSYYLNTPLAFAAKFGLVGIVVLLSWAWCACASLRRLVRRAG